VACPYQNSLALRVDAAHLDQFWLHISFQYYPGSIKNQTWQYPHIRYVFLKPGKDFIFENIVEAHFFAFLLPWDRIPGKVRPD